MKGKNNHQAVDKKSGTYDIHSPRHGLFFCIICNNNSVCFSFSFLSYFYFLCHDISSVFNFWTPVSSCAFFFGSFLSASLAATTLYDLFLNQ